MPAPSQRRMRRAGCAGRTPFARTRPAQAAVGFGRLEAGVEFGPVLLSPRERSGEGIK